MPEAAAAACARPESEGFDVVGRLEVAPLPRNARVYVVPRDGVGAAPASYRFALALGSEVVPASATSIARSVVLAPSAELAPNATYSVLYGAVSASDAGPPARPAGTLHTGGARDDAAPVLAAIGAPTVHPVAGELATDCDFPSWLDVPVDVKDDSPALVALWLRHTATIDFTTKPDLYARPRGGHVRVSAADVAGATRLGARAIDVAGNESGTKEIAIPPLGAPPPAPTGGGAGSGGGSGCSRSSSHTVSCSCDLPGVSGR